MLLNGRMGFVTGPQHCWWLSSSQVHPQLTADFSSAREAVVSYSLYLETPQNGDPHLPDALTQSCITLLGGSSSYLFMVNEINTYQRLSWVKPKSVQPMVLWLAETISRCPGRSMEARLHLSFPRALPCSSTVHFSSSPSWGWYLCFFRPWRIV